MSNKESESKNAIIDNLRIADFVDVHSAFEKYGKDYLRDNGYYDNEADEESIKEHIIKLAENYQFDAIKIFLADYNSYDKMEFDGYANLRVLYEPTINDIDDMTSFLGSIDSLVLGDCLITMERLVDLAKSMNTSSYYLFMTMIELCDNNEDFYPLGEIYDIEMLINNKDDITEEIFHKALARALEKSATLDNFSDFVLNEIKNTQEQSSKPKKQK